MIGEHCCSHSVHTAHDSMHAYLAFQGYTAKFDHIAKPLKTASLHSCWASGGLVADLRLPKTAKSHFATKECLAAAVKESVVKIIACPRDKTADLQKPPAEAAACGRTETLVDALPKVELLEVMLSGNHSLASDYGSSYEPFGMYMDSGEAYLEPLLLDTADSGAIHIVYHHCPYTDATLRGWKFQGNQFIVAETDETPLLSQRRAKMCIARHLEIRSDGEQEGSEVTLSAGVRQEPRFFGYRVDPHGYTAYFVAFTRLLPSACVYLKCCKLDSNLSCEIVFYDVRKPEKQSLFQTVVGAPSVPLSRECPLCLHNGGEDGVPLEYFTSIEDSVLSPECPNLKPHTYADSFVFLGPKKSDSRVHKHYAIGSLSNTLQIRNFEKMTQVSVQYPNNLWISRAGAHHQSFSPPEVERSYYIVRGAEYKTAESPPKTLQEVLFFYDSLSNAHENKGSEFIAGLRKRSAANTKSADAIFAEHVMANDMTYFFSLPLENNVRFVAGGSFSLPSSKFVSPALIKSFCVAPLFYDQWAVFLALEETTSSKVGQRQQALDSAQQSRSNTWENSPLPWWGDSSMPGYSSALRGQVLYMQVPISGSHSYNEMTLHVFNANSHRSFHCSAAGSASVLLFLHDAVNHVLHMEERLRDGSLLMESQIEIRRVLHGSLLPTRTVKSFEQGPDSVVWINLLTTKRFSVDESFYYVPVEAPGRLASIQRATGFYKDGDCIGEWAPSFLSPVCSHFCVSIHVYQVKLPPRGGLACAFEEGAELSRLCLESPCSQGGISSVHFNLLPDVVALRAAARAGSYTDNTQNVTPEDASAQSGATAVLGQQRDMQQQKLHANDVKAPNAFLRLGEQHVWQDEKLDTSTPVLLGTNGVASATIELEHSVDIWHIRIAFASAAVQSNPAEEGVASFKFALSVLDDAGDEIHKWQTYVPPTPAAQSFWELLDVRLYRAKSLIIESLQSFRVAELQVFGMPLPTCPPGGFLEQPVACASLDLCTFSKQKRRAEFHVNSSSKSRARMRVWHVLRSASATGGACPSSLFETRSCRTAQGCEVSLVHFPAPLDQPEAEENESAKELNLMRPIGGLFLVAAVVLVFLLLLLSESWRRWGTSMAAHREVLNVQRQNDLIAAREQILQYRQMIQEYRKKLEDEEANSVEGEAELVEQAKSLFTDQKSFLAREEQELLEISGASARRFTDMSELSSLEEAAKNRSATWKSGNEV
ncbi:hypothetical protein Efla_002507 [Eimeria flavescens]